jgi:hypothetical protein
MTLRTESPHMRFLNKIFPSDDLEAEPRLVPADARAGGGHGGAGAELEMVDEEGRCNGGEEAAASGGEEAAASGPRTREVVFECPNLDKLPAHFGIGVLTGPSGTGKST